MKKILSISFFIILVFILGFKSIKVNSEPNNKKVRFAVLFFNLNNKYTETLKGDLEEIQKNNQDKVEFHYYDGQFNEEIQKQQVEEAIKNNIDGILVSIVDYNNSSYFVNKAKEKNIPIIFFNREPNTLEAIRSYGRSVFIGTRGCESGMMQGDMILNQIKNNSIVDKNKNDKFEYILLKGEKGNIETMERSKCVIEELNKNGIITNELYSEFFNWNREAVKERLMPVLSRIADNVDIIISNNDEMAIGAIEVLQHYGYNLDNKSKYIPVVGVDGIPEAIALIEKGQMEGTVIQDAKEMANALYLIGSNLVVGKNPLENFNLPFDESGVAIRIPYPKYIIKGQ